MTPTLVTACTALPPEGANFSRGGPSKNCLTMRTGSTFPPRSAASRVAALSPEGANFSRGGPVISKCGEAKNWLDILT